MKWTGLTGGIATGKSTAKKLIEGRGLPVIDADAISHRISAIGEAGYQGILSHFGTSILKPDSSLDRKLLGEIIFSDAKKRTELENILHPLIQTEVRKQREIFREQGAKICFYDVPLLFEKNLWSDFDSTVLVWCSLDQQIERLCDRNRLSREQALLRINNQMNMLEKVKRADHCLDNSTSVQELDLQLSVLLQKLI